MQTEIVGDENYKLLHIFTKFLQSSQVVAERGVEVSSECSVPLDSRAGKLLIG